MKWHEHRIATKTVTMSLGSTQLLREISTRNISWGVKAAGAYGWQPCNFHVSTVLKSGSLNLLEPSGTVKACNGIVFLYQHCEASQFSVRTVLFMTTTNFRRQTPKIKPRHSTIYSSWLSCELAGILSTRYAISVFLTIHFRPIDTALHNCIRFFHAVTSFILRCKNCEQLLAVASVSVLYPTLPSHPPTHHPPGHYICD
jgi:hypothetical protein